MLDEPDEMADLADRVDWPLVHDLAKYHRLLGRLDEAIDVAEIGATVPARLRERLRDHRRGWARLHGDRIAPQVRELGDHLGAAGIPATLLKGGALVTEGIVAAGMRPLSDLDLLVAPADYTGTERVLHGIGYRPQPARPFRSGDTPVRFDRHYHGPPFRHPGRPLPIEVHWQLMSRGHRHWFDPGGLVDVPARGARSGTLRVLDIPDQLAHVALHHWYDRELGRPGALGQLWDVREVVARSDAAQLREALVRAARRGHDGVLTVVLAVQHGLIGGVQSPPRRIHDAASDPRVASFAIRRVLSRRPEHIQMMMVTPDVDLNLWRVLTRLAAHLHRDQWELAEIHGPGRPTTLRLRQWRMIGKLIACACRRPFDTLDELRLDRWAHDLR